MSKILVLGASGMAGHVVATYLNELGHDVATLSGQRKLNEQTELIDATNLNELINQLGQEDYAVVINCIGVLVKQSEASKDRAVLLNAHLPKLLEKYYSNKPTRVIHISSDGVFSGAQKEYVEDSLYDGQSFYSRSKALGEISNNKDLTIRTSIIGPQIDEQDSSLFNWFFSQTGEINGFSDSYWKGITTIELARAITAAIEQGISGIYHLVPVEQISKYDLLTLLKQVFDKKDLHIIPAQGNTSNANLRNTRTDFQHNIPSYLEMCSDMLAWIRDHPKLYSHYI